MGTQINESMQGILPFLQYFSVSLVFLLIFIFIYIMVTPYSEFKMINEGKIAPALSLGGAIVGYMMPLCIAVSHSVGLVDLGVWAIVAMIVQVAGFVVLRLVFRGIIKNIENDQISSGIFIATVSLTLGLLNASCITY